MKTILSKQPHKRLSKEINFVRKCLKNVKFFNELEESLPEDLMLRLCKYALYEKYPQFHRLYKAGHYGRKFYVILDGSVFVLVPMFNLAELKKEESSEYNKMVQDENYHLQKENKERKEIETGMSEEQIIEKIIALDNEGFQIKKTLSQGDGFGEIALRTEGIRTASIVCKQETHFLSISASVYQEIIEAHYDKLYKEKIDFLKNVSIFQRWNLSFIHQIMMQIKELSFKRGEIIYDVGNKSDLLYFVRSGEVELQKVIEVKTNNHTLGLIPNKLLKTNYIWNEKMKHSQKKICGLVILSEFQYFGDFEIFQKQKRIMRAVCHSNSEIFTLEKKEFFEVMQILNMVKEIHSLFKERESWYQDLITKTLSAENNVANGVFQSQPYSMNHITPSSSLNNTHMEDFGQNQNAMNLTSQNNITNYNTQFLNNTTSFPKNLDNSYQPLKLNSMACTNGQILGNKEQIPSNQLRNSKFFTPQTEKQKHLKKLNSIENTIRLKQFLVKSMNLVDHLYQQKQKEKLNTTISQKQIQTCQDLTSQFSIIKSSNSNLNNSQRYVPILSSTSIAGKSNENIRMPHLLSISNPFELHSRSKSNQKVCQKNEKDNKQKHISKNDSSFYLNQDYSNKNLQQLIAPLPQRISYKIPSLHDSQNLENAHHFQKQHLQMDNSQNSTFYQLLNNRTSACSSQHLTTVHALNSSTFEYSSPFSSTPHLQHENSLMKDKKQGMEAISALEDIGNLAEELEKEVIRSKLHPSCQNLDFIKSRLNTPKINKRLSIIQNRNISQNSKKYKLPSYSNQIQEEYHAGTAILPQKIPSSIKNINKNSLTRNESDLSKSSSSSSSFSPQYFAQRFSEHLGSSVQHNESSSDFKPSFSKQEQQDQK